jgi:hypothetical protein
MKILSKEEASNKGTSFKGYINATYSQLLEVLGETTYNDRSGDGKVNFEWFIEFEDEIFTIYDWKTYSKEYTENELVKWNVGGTTNAFDFIQEVETLINK